MKLTHVKEDGMIWTRRKPLNPELIDLIENLRKQPSGTYDVQLEHPVKTLKTSLKRFINVSVKAKDNSGKHWYVRTLVRKRTKKS